MLATKMS